MKKLLMTLSLLFITCSQAFAFFPEVSYFVNREVAVSRIVNRGFQPMVCSGYAFGQTYNGVVLNAWFNTLYVAPGVHADAYVYSNYYDPFIRAWAQIDCQFTW